MIDTNENINKYKFILNLIRDLHKEVLYTFLHREISHKILNIIERSHSKSYFSNDATKIKKNLFETVDSLRRQYKKIIDLKSERDIYEEIINKINELFPVFPHDFTEFEFERTMNRAFENDLNNAGYYKNNINNISQKYYK
jgi:hypothetical protein